jgi:hypothetical protein
MNYLSQSARSRVAECAHFEIRPRRLPIKGRSRHLQRQLVTLFNALYFICNEKRVTSSAATWIHPTKYSSTRLRCTPSSGHNSYSSVSDTASNNLARCVSTVTRTLPQDSQLTPLPKQNEELVTRLRLYSQGLLDQTSQLRPEHGEDPDAPQPGYHVRTSQQWELVEGDIQEDQNSTLDDKRTRTLSIKSIGGMSTRSKSPLP